MERTPHARRRLSRRRPSPDERREQIVAAAVRLFARRGFARTTTREIAAEAGIAEGTIYTYFPSKQDLLFSFIQTYAVQPLQSLLGAEGTEEEVVRGFFLDRLSRAATNRALMKVVIGEALFEPRLAREFSRKVTDPVTLRLRAFVDQAQREGRFRDVDPGLAAGTMVGLFLTFAVLWPALMPQKRKLPPTPVLARQLASLFLHGVARTPPRSLSKEPRR